MSSIYDDDDADRVSFARSGEHWIAYQILGDGPVDVIFSIGWLSSFRAFLKNRTSASFFEKLSKNCRLILFDKRGTGMSDRDVGIATLEDRADDIRAVLDAVGSEKCTIIGLSEGANISAMFAATYPERTRSLILISCTACVAWKPDWQDGFRRAEFEQYKSELVANWGQPTDMARLAPSVANDPEERSFWTEMLLSAASPSSAERMAHMWYQMDIRPILPSIHVPSLVIHRRDETAIPFEQGRKVAELLPQSKFVELEGIDHVPWYGDSDSVVSEIHEFLRRDEAVTKSVERKLLSILVTDVVGSSQFALKLGDADWSTWAENHFDDCQRIAREFGGVLIKTMGDGAILSFAGPSAAIDCAKRIRAMMSDEPVDLRMGIHTGECIQHDGDLSGVAVNLATRITSEADPNQILVSSTVSELAFGSDFGFEAKTPCELKGFEGEWTLFGVK